MVAGYISLCLSVSWSHCMSLPVSHYCWLSITVSSSSMESLHASHYLSLLLVVSHCLSYFHGVASYLSRSLICFGCLSLSLPVLRSCCIFLTISNCCWLSLNFSTSSMELRDGQQQYVTEWQTFSNSIWLEEIARESQQQWETARNM